MISLACKENEHPRLLRALLHFFFFQVSHLVFVNLMYRVRQRSTHVLFLLCECGCTLATRKGVFLLL